ncbi:coiled-coil domain-containing protein 25 isoform X5 [Eubalaena glacialis]|uniref:coiled-coil domain-containing protein 25 isoform X5 n=1 Tax=Eubalaena glacialis TaxID=27606 RepID=UPI002A59CAED|nr:coiled-coil domain-containing protein 25 isoform X5 [Eubalaena glacialis]
MVFYFTSSSVNSSAYTIYMGKDKYENEDLIKYGWPEDIWFHVDKLSSAHVYLRLHKGEKIEDIPKEVLMDCAHLVKANSIQGGSCTTCQRTESQPPCPSNFHGPISSLFYPVFFTLNRKLSRASLVAQWLRTHLPVQGTRV